MIDPATWADRMLAGALRFRADVLRERALAEPDERMVRRVTLALAVAAARRAWRDVERCDHAAHRLLDRPRRHTIDELQAASAARAEALARFMRWADVVHEGAAALAGDADDLWLNGYLHGHAKEQPHGNDRSGR